jgi:antitoxin (DNA-binding transcriptional repressor) of toxin-antitoxin stability system
MRNVITRRGKPVAKKAIKPRRKPIDLAALCKLTDAMPMQRQSARVFVRWMRDRERY